MPSDGYQQGDCAPSRENPLKKLMPPILHHSGVWQGEYQHLDIQGNIIDQHASQVECVFPDTVSDPNDPVYIQRNEFTWEDGRKHKIEFSGVMKGDRIWWDTETFSGYGWQASPAIFLLELERKDVVGASFLEAIVMGSSLTNRARTWHWFKGGTCYQRTLCNENLVS